MLRAAMALMQHFNSSKQEIKSLLMRFFPVIGANVAEQSHFRERFGCSDGN
jgi:hypothetical protein